MSGREERSMRADAAHLERLRGWRVPARPAEALSIVPLVEKFTKGIARERRGTSKLDEAWDVVVPMPMGALVRPATLVRGTLSVRCADDAAWFEFDRAFRSGLRAELQKGLGGLVLRVKRVM